jgi:PQQ-like domain
MTPLALFALIAALLVQDAAPAPARPPAVGAETPETSLEIRFDDEALIERVGALRALLAKDPLGRDEIRELTLALRSLRACGEPQLAPQVSEDVVGTVALIPLPERRDLAIAPRAYALRLALALPDEALAAHVALEAQAAEARRSLGAPWAEIGRLFPLAPLGQEGLWREALAALEAGDARRALAHLEDVDLAAARGLAAPAATLKARRSLELLAVARLGDRPLVGQIARQAAAEGLTDFRIGGRERELSAFTAELVAGLPEPKEGPERLAQKASWTRPWPSPEDSGARPSPKLGASALFLHNHRRVAALDLHTGRPLWTRSFAEKDGFPAPRGDLEFGAFEGALGGGAYLFAARDRDEDDSRDSALVALEAETGKTRWVHRRSLASGAMIWDPAPLVMGDLVIATGHDQKPIPATWIVGIDLKTGVTRWSRRLRSKIPFRWQAPPERGLSGPRTLGCSAPVAVGRLLALTDHRGQILILDPRDGMPQLLCRYERRRAESGFGGGGNLAFGWRQSPVVAEGDRLACAPNDCDQAICLAARPDDSPATLRRGEILVRYETIPRRGAYRLGTLRKGHLLIAARDRDLEMDVLRGLRPFPAPEALRAAAKPSPWAAPFPLEGPIWAFGDSGGKNVYVGTEGYVYRVNGETGRAGDPQVTLGPKLRGPGALLVHPEGLVVVGPTVLAFIAAEKP